MAVVLDYSNWQIGTLLVPTDLERLGLIHLLINHQGYFNVPVEAVIRRPGEAIWPKQGRFSSTHMFLVEGKLISYDQLSKLPGFNGTSEYSDQEIMLSEVWSNGGSDGHTCYGQRGWVLLPWKTLKDDLDTFEKARCSRGDVPFSMY